MLRFQLSVPAPALLHLPTFMRALPKKKETFMPAGIDNAPPDARKRWKAHAWRYPPYQYRREFCFSKRQQGAIAVGLRVATATEREVLMFLGRGPYTLVHQPSRCES